MAAEPVQRPRLSENAKTDCRTHDVDPEDVVRAMESPDIVASAGVNQATGLKARYAFKVTRRRALRSSGEVYSAPFWLTVVYSEDPDDGGKVAISVYWGRPHGVRALRTEKTP